MALRTAQGAVTLAAVTAVGAVSLAPKVHLNATETLSGATEMTVTSYSDSAITFNDAAGSPTGSLKLGVENRNTGSTGWIDVTVAGGGEASGSVTLGDVTAVGNISHVPKVWLNTSQSLSGAVAMTVTSYSDTAITFTDPEGAPSGSVFLGVQNPISSQVGWISATVTSNYRGVSGSVTLGEITSSSICNNFADAESFPAISVITASGSAETSVIQRGNGAVDLTEITSAGSVAQTYKPSSSVSVGEITTAGQIAQTYKPSGSATISEVTSSGAAQYVGQKSASGEPTLLESTSSGSVKQTYKPSGSITLDIVSSGSVKQTYRASGAVILDEVTSDIGFAGAPPITYGISTLAEIGASGQATRALNVSGSITLDINSSGAVTQTYKPSGSVELGDIAASGGVSVVGSVTASSEITVGEVTASGLTSQTYKPYGSVTASEVTSSGQITQTYKTGSAVTLGEITSSGAVNFGHYHLIATVTITPSSTINESTDGAEKILLEDGYVVLFEDSYEVVSGYSTVTASGSDTTTITPAISGTTSITPAATGPVEMNTDAA